MSILATISVGLVVAFVVVIVAVGALLVVLSAIHKGTWREDDWDE